MKTAWRILVVALVWLGPILAGRGGTDPTNTPDVFQIESVHLDATTFIVTVTICTPRTDLIYGVLAHDGPAASNATWQAIGEQVGNGSTAVFLDDVSGSLTHTGRSYRGFVSLELGAPPAQRVLTRNEEFLAYPFMNAPTLSVNPTSPATDHIVIDYGESLYSNRVGWTIPGDADHGVFRMYTPDGDPSNAVIQIAPDAQAGSWTNLPE